MHTQTQRHTQMRTQTHPGNLCSVLESRAPESLCLQVSCKLGLQREPSRQLWAWEPVKVSVMQPQRDRRPVLCGTGLVGTLDPWYHGLVV